MSISKDIPFRGRLNAETSEEKGGVKMSIKEFKKETSDLAEMSSWVIWKFLPLFLMVVGLLFLLGFGLKSIGIFGNTVVERKVYENSYQRSESIKSQIAIDEAALAEINIKLSNPNLDENTRYNLKAQKSAIKIRLEATRRKQ